MILAWGGQLRTVQEHALRVDTIASARRHLMPVNHLQACERHMLVWTCSFGHLKNIG